MSVTSLDELERADARVFQRGDETRPATTPFILVRGSGCQVWDLHGREYLDAHAGAWLCQIGHGRQEMADVAAQQMATLEHFTTHGDFRNPAAIELAERLVELSPIVGGKVRFATSGSEADDDALQTVREFQRRRGLPGKSTVLTIAGAYHGHSYGGLELAGRLDPVPGRSTVQLTMPDLAAFPSQTPESITDICVTELRHVIAELGADSIAAMFGEPVFGPAGMFAPPDDYWVRMTEVLRENDILFVADEVVTAFGRSGEWFGVTLSGVVPDVIVVAKGLASGYAPIAATIISAEIARTLAGHHGGGSYAGHPVACALALKNIEIIEREHLLQNSRARGEQLLAGLRDRVGQLPGVVAIRGVGLMVSVWFDPDRAVSRDRVLDTVIRDDFGLIVMGSHHRIVVTPPLTVSESEIDDIIDTLSRAISANFH